MILPFRFVSYLILAVLVRPESPPHTGRGYFVSPTGSRGGDGSQTRPWDLATALVGGGGRVQPGDTIWLRGGTYRGAFRSTLRGQPGAPVVVRQFPGERAIIDGATSKRDTWVVAGEYSVFWGFELTNSDPKRETASSTENLRPDVIANYAAHTKFINLVVHDGGVALYTDAHYPDVEIAGCIFYNNGWQEPDGGHGHAMYIKSYTGPLVARDNIAFNQYGYGIHAYTNASTGKLVNITIEGNVAFNNGVLARRSLSPNILLGGAGYATGGVVRDNLTYYAPTVTHSPSSNVTIGWKELRNGDVTVEENYFVGGSPVLTLGFWSAARIANNTLISRSRPRSVRRDVAARTVIWRDNEEPPTPTATKIVVRPNPHEAGRAHVVVYNWGRQREVDVDVSAVLSDGDRYEVRNVQDLFGAPVASGTVTGNVVTVPLGGVRAPVPVGLTVSPAPQTGPAFDVFVVTRLTSR